MSLEYLKEQINKYIPYNEQEEMDKTLMLEFIDKNENCLTRESRAGHFTASNWIVNKDRTKVLMIYHNIYKSWAWTGGHADGDENLLHVALKEAEEESNLKNLKPLVDGIFSLESLTVDGHVKRGKYVSSHLHLNCSFLFEADEQEELKIKEDENSGVKWLDIDKVIDLVREENMKPIYAKLNQKLLELGI
ncbi:MAG: NUDIX hydrolase [Clostridia bacterium]|nr:NUDIX hydrolase [Clostridia bacterium]